MPTSHCVSRSIFIDDNAFHAAGVNNVADMKCGRSSSPVFLHGHVMESIDDVEVIMLFWFLSIPTQEEGCQNAVTRRLFFSVRDDW